MNAEDEPQSDILIEQQSDVPEPSAQSQVAKSWFPRVYVTQGQCDDAFAWFFYWLPVSMLILMITPQIIKLIIRIVR